MKLHTNGYIKVWGDEDGSELLVGQSDSDQWPTSELPGTVWVESVGGGTGLLQMEFIVQCGENDVQVDMIGKYFTATAVTVESVEIKEGSSSTPDICEEVTFVVETDPAGYEQFVQWSGGGCPDSDGTGAEFPTKWSCIGQKTVTASLCSSSASANVDVELPDGEEMAASSVFDLSFAVGPGVDDFNHYGAPGPEGEFGWFIPEAAPDPEFKFCYSNCKWVCEVDVIMEVRDRIEVAGPNKLMTEGGVMLTPVYSYTDIDCNFIETAEDDLFDWDVNDANASCEEPLKYCNRSVKHIFL